ncbi:MAG: hypothetical protein GY714_20795 [Desulfobacterales bacterium]|nr:hypothetical protein [Desulfobacterales bacterium]
MASIADDLNFNVEDFEQFIEYLITDCELIQRKNGFITSDIIQDNYEKVAEKRKKNALSYKKRHSDNFRNIQTAESEIQTAEFIQSKVKKSKEKKSILNIDLLKQVVDYLNTKLSSKYKYQSKKTQDLINARFKEGFTFEDFKYVIDIKYKEWSSDPKQYMYLRPETLFSNKFEGYRNQKEKAEAKKINWLEDYAIEEDKNDK